MHTPNDKAQELVALAQNASSPALKELLLAMAMAWQQIAESVERIGATVPAEVVKDIAERLQ